MAQTRRKTTSGQAKPKPAPSKSEEAPTEAKPPAEAPAEEAPEKGQVVLADIADEEAAAAESERKAEAEAAEAAEKEAVSAPAPASAPLEPPEPRQPSATQSRRLPTVADSAVALAANARGARIVDSATGATPDPDTVFAPVGVGNAQRVLVRLVKREDRGIYGGILTTLLFPAGQRVTSYQAEQIKAVLRRQRDTKRAT